MAVNILTQQNLNSASARVQIMPETCQTEIEREERERRERVSSWFFVTVTYNVIIIHIFPENLIKIPHLFRRYEDFFLQYLLFSSIFFFFFDLSLLQKKLITSSCNK